MAQQDPSDTPPLTDAAQSARVLCPYCGHIQPVSRQCSCCRGLFDVHSRQATQNAMGPWFIRTEAAPHQPGCSYETLRDLAAKGRLTRETIIRGPTTRQFWNMAANTPGVAVLLGECHACHQPAETDDYMCIHCGVTLAPASDRQHLGLLPIRPVQPGVHPSAQAAPVGPAPVSATPGQMVERPAQPQYFAPVVVAPAASDTDVAERALQRKSRQQQQARTMNRVILVVMLLCLAGVGAVIYLLRERPASSTTSNTPAGAVAPTQVPSLSDRFSAEIQRAQKLSETGKAADLDEAIEALQRLRKAASPSSSTGAALPAADAEFLSRIDETIDKLKTKLAEVRLRETLAKPSH